MVSYRIVWYGMVWYGIVSYRIVSYRIVSNRSFACFVSLLQFEFVLSFAFLAPSLTHVLIFYFLLITRTTQYLTAEEKVDPPPEKKAKREHLEEHLASFTADELVWALRKKGRMSGDLFVSVDEAKILSPTKEDKAAAAEQAAVHTANLRRAHMQVHSARDLLD
jgi:hypothetical protein